MRLPGVADVERVNQGRPPTPSVPTLDGAGAALESVGLSLVDVAADRQAKIDAEIEKQQRIQDLITYNKTIIGVQTQASEALRTWQLEADTTSPEAFSAFNESIGGLTKAALSGLPATVSPEARAHIENQLRTTQLSFSEEAGRVYTASLQNAAIDSVNDQINQFAMQAAASPDRLDDILDLATESLSMFRNVLPTEKEREALHSGGASIYAAAITGYLGAERINDAERLLNDTRYSTMLTPEQRQTLTGRIASMRSAMFEMNAVDSLVTEALGTTGGGGDLVTLIVGAENATGDPGIKNPMSSATGDGQFIASTWLDLMKGRPEAEGRSEAEILALRSDPALSRQMVGVYAQQNATALRNQGLPVDNGTLYLAHFAGPQGAVALLKADPATPVEDILDAGAIAANPTVLPGKTAGEVIAWAAGKMGGAVVQPAAAEQSAAEKLQAQIAYVEASTARPDQKRDAIAQLVTQYNRDAALKQVETDTLFDTALHMVWDGKAADISVSMRADLEEAGLWDQIGTAIYDKATGVQQTTDWLWLTQNYLSKTPEKQAEMALAEIKEHTDGETYAKIAAARQESEAPYMAQTPAQYLADRVAPLKLDPKDAEDQQSLGALMREYEAQVSTWQEKNGQQAPDDVHREIIDRLTGQIALKNTRSLWFSGTTELPVFKLFDITDEKTIDVAEDAGVPVEYLPDIVRSLQSFGIPVTLDSISQAYQDGRVD
jgi:hypothetical protein